MVDAAFNLAEEYAWYDPRTFPGTWRAVQEVAGRECS
jgi:hypothetical protein